MVSLLHLRLSKRCLGKSNDCGIGNKVLRHWDVRVYNVTMSRSIQPVARDLLLMYSFRYSVTAITVRFHRADRGSTPRIGVHFFVFNQQTTSF